MIKLLLSINSQASRTLIGLKYLLHVGLCVLVLQI